MTTKEFTKRKRNLIPLGSKFENTNTGIKTKITKLKNIELPQKYLGAYYQLKRITTRFI